MPVTAHTPSAEPQAMRDLVRDYVHTVHTSYLDHTRDLPVGERGALPLLSGQRVTVIAAAARRLHLLATARALPPPQGHEVEVADGYLGVSWLLRFFDPSVVPELGLLTEDDPAEVRRVLGVTDVLYHLAVDVGGGLGGHHAQHSGVALANQHARTARELDRVRRSLPRQARTVDELGACVRNGLDRAAALLAADLTAGRASLEPGTPAAACLKSVVDDVTR